MSKTYKINIAGCERELPLCEVSESLDIAAFIMFGDVEVTEASARELLKRCPEHDVIVTAEAKGIPLGYEMARQEKGEYVVARKGLKVYMPEYINVEVRSITTLSVQRLYIGTDDINKIKG
jgi:adenine phosphoribosyltransferase